MITMDSVAPSIASAIVSALIIGWMKSDAAKKQDSLTKERRADQDARQEVKDRISSIAFKQEIQGDRLNAANIKLASLQAQVKALDEMTKTGLSDVKKTLESNVVLSRETFGKVILKDD